MLPEYFTAPLVTLIFYLLVLSLLSSVYVDFIRRKKLGAYNTMIIILFLLLLVLIVIVLFIVFISFTLSLSVRSLSLFLLTLTIFVLVTTTPVLFRILCIIRALRKAILREYELEGMKVKLYVYTDSHVNAFYKARSVYVHEELLRVLSDEELKAVMWHEWGHHEQVIQQPFSWLRIIALLATFFWILGGPVLTIVAGYLFHTLLVSLMMGTVPNEALIMLLFTTSIHLITSTLSLIPTCVTWMKEHSADFHAVGKVGVETFARALIKVYFTSYLYEKAKYVKLEDFTTSLRLDKVQPLTWLDVFKELVLQTLLARGFIDIVTKPLVETHPPLYLRLRAVGTVFR